jgi:hypothetical protein
VPLWLRVILIIAVIGLVIAGTTGYLGYRWWSNNRGRLVSEGRRAMAEGKELGRGREAPQCIEAMIKRLQSCAGVPCELKTRLYFDGCLSTAELPPLLCTSIPPQDEIMKLVDWTRDECARRGMPGDPRCGRVLMQLRVRCDRGR